VPDAHEKERRTDQDRFPAGSGALSGADNSSAVAGKPVISAAFRHAGIWHSAPRIQAPAVGDGCVSA
jgi:hypothetical protein